MKPVHTGETNHPGSRETWCPFHDPRYAFRETVPAQRCRQILCRSNFFNEDFHAPTQPLVGSCIPHSRPDMLYNQSSMGRPHHYLPTMSPGLSPVGKPR